MLANDPAHYKRISALTAVSPHGACGVGNDLLCDYPAVEYTCAVLDPDFSRKQASRFARQLKALKRTGPQMVGMLRFLLGNYVPYMQGQIGTKRETGFAISNLGSVEAPRMNGRWSVGHTVFGQHDSVVGMAFSINITGDPTGALNIAFSLGESSVDTVFC